MEKVVLTGIISLSQDQKGVPYQVGVRKFPNSFVNILCSSLDLIDISSKER